MARKFAGEPPEDPRSEPAQRPPQDAKRQSRRAAAWSLALARRVQAPQEPKAGKG
jgi:hypothetical protein